MSFLCTVYALFIAKQVYIQSQFRHVHLTKIHVLDLWEENQSAQRKPTHPPSEHTNSS